MNNRVLLEILQDKRVQKLVKIAVDLYKDYSKDDLQMHIIDILREELSSKKEGPSSKWIQSEFPL